MSNGAPIEGSDRTSAQGDRPLKGLRVVDLSRVAPGLFCTMLLGDMGADVITIEAPESSMADSRITELPTFGAAVARHDGLNEHWRSRRSAILDLKSAGGRDALLRLAERADVFVEGFRPGTCDRLGIGYRQIQRAHREIIYCSITGFGQGTELAQQAGHDLNYIAEAGLMSALIRGESRPGIPLNLVADIAAAGLQSAFSILVALERRRRNGLGCHLDISMFEGVLGMLSGAAAWRPDGSWGSGLLSGAAPFYDCYKTTDGGWLSVAALEPKFFKVLCERIGRPELHVYQRDVERWPKLREELARIFGSATLEEWTERLAGADCAVAPVRSIGEAFELGRRLGVVSRGFAVGPLPRLPETNELSGVVTRPGVHTEDVLAEAGFAEDEIRDLLASRAAVQAPIEL